MTKPLAVLILGGLGDIGQSAQRVIERHFPGASVVVADARTRTAGSDHLEIPSATSPEYFECLEELVERHAVDIILPTNETEIRRLVSEDLAGLGCRVLVEDRESVEVFGDKLDADRWCRDHGIDTLPTESYVEGMPIAFPAVLKPRRGSGGKDQVIARDRADLRRLRDGSAYVLQPLIQNFREFTCVSARRESELEHIVLERLLRGGRSRWIRVADDERIAAVAKRVGELLQPVHSVNFQFLSSDSGLSLIDINPRFSSTVGMRDLIGFSDLRWALDRAIGHPPQPYAPPEAGTVVEWADETGTRFDVHRGSDGHPMRREVPRTTSEQE